MSTESTFHYDDTDLADGRLHSLPCPSPEHQGEPGDHDLLVRFAANVTVTGAASGVWQLRCWTGLCAYDSIAESLGIDLPRVRSGVAHQLPFLAAVHHNDEDGQARLAFQSTWSELHPGQPDRCAWPGCEEPIDWGHTHEGARGTVQGTHVALWGATDTDETALVVVGDVEAAALLYRAGLHSLYTPVTWYEARAGSRAGSISDCDWSAVSGRELVIWLDEDAVASGRLELVARKAEEAGAASLHVVDSRAPIGDDATEALIALESRRPFGAGDVSPGSGAARGEPEPDEPVTPGEQIDGVRGEPEPDEPVTPGEQIDGVHGEPEPDDPVTPGEQIDEVHWTPEPDEPAATAELLSTRPEFATDIGLALRFLADHGDGLVGASDPFGEAASIYRTTAAGPLDPVGDDDLSVLMLRSQGRYLAEAGRESPAGLSPVQVAHARLMGSERAPGLVRRNLRAAFLALQDRGAAPAGYRQVSIADIDGDTRYLGAPNGVVDLSAGALLTGRRASSILVCRRLPDPYDPDARHADVDRLFAGTSPGDRDALVCALGAALLGIPGGRVHLVAGGGRDVGARLLVVVLAALGQDHAIALPEGVLTGSNRGVAQTSVNGPAGSRLLVGRAAATGGTIDIDMGTNLTISDSILSRTFQVRPVAGRPVPTVFLAVSSDLLEYGAVTDAALLTQFQVLHCTDPAGMDSTLRDRMGDDPHVRQAMVAMLVRACVAGPGPTPAPTLGHHRRDAPAAWSTTAAQWIAGHVIVTGDAGDRLSSASLWDAARTDPSSGPETDRAWGLTRRRFTTLVRKVVGLDPPTQLREAGEVIFGWQGVRLVTGRS